MTLCATVFIAVQLLDVVGVMPRERVVWLFGLSYEGVIGQGRLYQFFTAPFLHATFLDLLFNMLALITLGPAVERTLGKVQFLKLSALSAMASMIAFLLLSPRSAVAVGYSDVMFGVFVAQAVFFPDQTVMVYGVFPLKMRFVRKICG